MNPPAEEGVGLAERGVGVNEFTAGHWVFTDEITITETDDDDHAGRRG